MNKNFKLETPQDVRKQIKEWIYYATCHNKLPFEKDGGIIVQLLNCWLHSYQEEKTSELEQRVEALEKEKKEREREPPLVELK